MSRRYAEGTTVDPAKSRMEIEAALTRYGADQFASGYDADQAAIMFRASGRQVRFTISLPKADDPEFRTNGRGFPRKPAERETAAQAENRRRWRALLLAIKAKLEVVESGIATFEEEFAAHVVLPDGSTVGQWLAPQLAEVYESGQMPSSLMALGSGQ